MTIIYQKHNSNTSNTKSTIVITFHKCIDYVVVKSITNTKNTLAFGDENIYIIL